MSSSALPFITLTLAAACWGLATVVSKGILRHIPLITLLAIQLAASLILLWTMVILRRVRVPPARQALRLGLAGLLEPGLANTFGLIGLSLTTASMASLMWAVEPILILVLAGLMLRENLTRPLMGLSALAIIGVVLVVGIDPDMGNGARLVGNLITLVGVSCCALYTVLTRRVAMSADPVLLAALQQTLALLWVLTIWPIELLGGRVNLAIIQPDQWLWAAASGVLYYALAFGLYITGLKHTPASLAGLFLNLVPIFGVGGAYLFLNESLSAPQLLGAALILAAVTGVFRWQTLEADRRADAVRSQA